MSDYKQDPLQSIDAQLEEKIAKTEGLANELQKAKSFVQQNEPEFFALQGAIRELQELKSKITGEPIRPIQPKTKTPQDSSEKKGQAL